MTRDFIISKNDKGLFHQMLFDKHVLGLHGGIIGDYNDTECVVTLLNEWIPYLKEYGIKYREVKKYFDEDYNVEYERKKK